MNAESRADQIRDARAAYAARREAAREDISPSRNSASPQAVEATLASISEEVTADAIERRREKIRDDEDSRTRSRPTT